jgi:hypothetical protein
MTYVFQAWARISNTLKEVPSKKIQKVGRGKIFDLIPLTNSLFRRRRRSGRAAAEKSSNDSQKR